MNDRRRDEDRLVRGVMAYLDATSADLDESARIRLRAARRRAVEMAGRPRNAGWGWWPPAAGVALAVGVLALFLYLPKAPPPKPSVVAPTPEYLEMLALSASPDFIEDLEFLEWLAGENDDAG